MVRSLGRLALLAAAAFFPLAAHAATAHGPSLKALPLQRGEVPHNCRLLSGQVITNAYVEASRRLTASQLAAYGRVSGYATTYVCSGTKGMQEIASEVAQFKNASGAQRFYQMVVAGDEAQVDRLGSFRRLSTRGLGDASVGFSYEAKAMRANMSLNLYGLTIFRHGHYLGVVEVVGHPGTWKTSAVTSFGHLIDTRLKRAA